MLDLTRRWRDIISGLIAITLVAGLSTVGVKFAFGAFDDGYEVVANFPSAGQGLIKGSDVKIRGVDIGRVSGVELVDGQARVTLFINDGVQIPANAQAVVRPKTLFGEKFVDIAYEELSGPFLADGDTIENTLGGFELERVLADAFPVLEAVDPTELFTILSTLSDAADGLGENVNRSIVNGEAVLGVQAAHDADLRQFLDDFAALSDELSTLAPDLVAGAADLNVALPVIAENPEAFRALLVQLERVSGQLADTLLANTAFIDSAYGDGQELLDVLFARRDQIVPLVIGLRQYVQTLAEVGRIPVGDGTMMAAVKGITGGEACTSGLSILGLCPDGSTTDGNAVAPAAAPATPTPEVLDDAGFDEISGEVSEGGGAVLDLVAGAFYRSAS